LKLEGIVILALVAAKTEQQAKILDPNLTG
jgi:hypothetical protein